MSRKSKSPPGYRAKPENTSQGRTRVSKSGRILRGRGNMRYRTPPPSSSPNERNVARRPTPARRILSDRSRSPQRRRSRSRSPDGRYRSSRRRIRSLQRKRSTSPQRRAVSPQRLLESSQEQLKSARQQSPRRHSKSLPRRSISPRRHSKSPRKRSKSPRRGSESSRGPLKYPRRDSYSQSDKTDSPQKRWMWKKDVSQRGPESNARAKGLELPQSDNHRPASLETPEKQTKRNRSRSNERDYHSPLHDKRSPQQRGEQERHASSNDNEGRETPEGHYSKAERSTFASSNETGRIRNKHREKQTSDSSDEQEESRDSLYVRRKQSYANEEQNAARKISRLYSSDDEHNVRTETGECESKHGRRSWRSVNQETSRTRNKQGYTNRDYASQSEDFKAHNTNNHEDDAANTKSDNTDREEEEGQGRVKDQGTTLRKSGRRRHSRSNSTDSDRSTSRERERNQKSRHHHGHHHRRHTRE